MQGKEEEPEEAMGEIKVTNLLQSPILHLGHLRDIMVPGRKVGLVIGRGGETINRLMHETGARMWVDQQSRTQDAEFKRLNIKGTAQQVEDALKLVNEIIGETAP
ncbi:unnamed protein product, partial [Nesidiocoris tenuis]